MANKKYDIVAKVGEKDGKAQWKNVGAVIQGDNGPYLIMDRTFNPAGIPNPENRSNTILSLFEPRDNQQGQQGGQQQGGGTHNFDDDFSDSVPF